LAVFEDASPAAMVFTDYLQNRLAFIRYINSRENPKL
jgi:hypothetical protein